jgi:hypothetical protein
MLGSPVSSGSPSGAELLVVGGPNVVDPAWRVLPVAAIIHLGRAGNVVHRCLYCGKRFSVVKPPKIVGATPGTPAIQSQQQPKTCH